MTGIFDDDIYADESTQRRAKQYVSLQEISRQARWPNPRASSQPDPPWPSRENPMLAYLVAQALGLLKAHGDARSAILWLAVHAWFEGGIAGYDRAMLEVLAAGGSLPAPEFDLDRQVASDFSTLLDQGSVIGPAEHAQDWRAGIKRETRRRRIRVRTGLLADGRPWAALPESMAPYCDAVGLSVSYGIPYLLELWAYAADHPADDLSDEFGGDFGAALRKTVEDYRQRRLQEDLDRYYEGTDE